MKQLISAIYENGVLRPLDPVDLAEGQTVRIHLIVNDSRDGNQKITRLPVKSSMIASIGYDSREKVLEIEFQNGRIYQYLNVPERVFRELMKAESQGSYFNSLIRDAFVDKRIR